MSWIIYFTDRTAHFIWQSEITWVRYCLQWNNLHFSRMTYCTFESGPRHAIFHVLYYGRMRCSNFDSATNHVLLVTLRKTIYFCILFVSYINSNIHMLDNFLEIISPYLFMENSHLSHIWYISHESFSYLLLNFQLLLALMQLQIQFRSKTFDYMLEH